MGKRLSLRPSSRFLATIRFSTGCRAECNEAGSNQTSSSVIIEPPLLPMVEIGGSKLYPCLTCLQSWKRNNRAQDAGRNTPSGGGRGPCVLPRFLAAARETWKPTDIRGLSELRR